MALYSYHGTDRRASSATAAQYLELYSPAVKWLLGAQLIGLDPSSKGGYGYEYALEVLQFLPWIRLRSQISTLFGLLTIPIPDPDTGKSGFVL